MTATRSLVLSILLVVIAAFALMAETTGGLSLDSGASIAGGRIEPTGVAVPLPESVELPAESGLLVYAFGAYTPPPPEGSRLEAALVAEVDTVSTAELIVLEASVSNAIGDVAQYEWDLNGDGAYEAVTDEPSLAHAYADDGAHLARLRVTDAAGRSAVSDPLELFVVNRAPTPAAAVSAVPATDVTPIEFIDDSIDPDGRIVAWTWNFGDGAVSHEQHPTHAYSDAGDYTVTLTVTDDDGASAACVTDVQIGNSLPVVGFRAAAWVATGETVVFLDESIDPSPDGRIVHVGWDFGDGAYFAGSPSVTGEYAHAYAEPGTYTVTLYVIDDDGGLSRVQARVIVRA